MKNLKSGLRIRKESRKHKGVTKMKKILGICFAGAMAIGFLTGTARANLIEPPSSIVHGTNLVRSWNYEGGFMVGMVDEATKQETVYSAGQAVNTVVLAGGQVTRVKEDEDGNKMRDGDGNLITETYTVDENMIIETYEYVRGSLQTIEDFQTGETRYFGGSQGRPLYSMNHEGHKTEDYIYNKDGFLEQVDFYGMVYEYEEWDEKDGYREDAEGKAIKDDDGEKIKNRVLKEEGEYAKTSYTEYDDHGRVKYRYELEDPRDADSGFMEDPTTVYHYDGRQLVKVVSNQWNDGEYEFNDEGEEIGWIEGGREETVTYYDSTGRPSYRVNNEGSVIERWNYEGAKLISNEKVHDGNVTSRTYYDVYGRASVEYEVEIVDGMEKETNPTYHEYNDTNETVMVEYDIIVYKTETVTDEDGEEVEQVVRDDDGNPVVDEEKSETETVSVGPGGKIRTVSAEQATYENAWSCGIVEHKEENVWEEVTYFNYNNPQDTVMENFEIIDGGYHIADAMTIMDGVISKDKFKEVFGYEITEENVDEAVEDLLEWANNFEDEYGVSGGFTDANPLIQELFKFEITFDTEHTNRFDGRAKELAGHFVEKMGLLKKVIAYAGEELYDKEKAKQVSENYLEVLKAINIESRTPALTGTFEGFRWIDGEKYIEISGDQIAMHVEIDGQQFQSAEGETFLIAADDEAFSMLEGREGEEFMFNFDVSSSKDGYWVGQLNYEYGCDEFGYGIVENVKGAVEKIEAGAMGWYNFYADLYAGEIDGFTDVETWEEAWALLEERVQSP